MSYRTLEIAWTPRTTTEWVTFTASRREAARVWRDLVVRHHRIRRLGWTWPSKARWQRWAKGRYPGISAQSAQQLIGEFCEAVDSCRQLRKNGQTEARYPWRKPRYHDVVYTNQDARIRGGRLVLPHGTSGTLRIRLPETITLPGRLIEVRLSFGVVRLVCEVACEVADAPRSQQTVIGVDLGVNTLIAATDGAMVFLVSGRGVKVVIQWRNKTLADIQWRKPPRSRARAAGNACNGASITCSTRPSARSAMRAIKPRMRWPRRSLAPPATSGNRSMTPPSAPDAYRPNR
jgi:hypothetical protein